jgi:DNA-binding FadR family transcriptional regulator
MDDSALHSDEDQMFKLIKTKKVYMQVLEQIWDLIRNGKLKPGDKLPPERILAQRLGVSRPSVREGIVALEILGLVDTRGGKGNIIKNVDNSSMLNQNYQHLKEEESPFELLEARKIIEVDVAGYAAQKAETEDIALIKHSLDSMREIVDNLSVSKEYEKGMQFDREFHISIARATHNAVLLRIVTTLLETLKENLWVRLKEKSWAVPGTPQKYLKEHEEILEAIEIKGRAIARKKMYRHLAGIQRDLFGRASGKKLS